MKTKKATIQIDENHLVAVRKFLSEKGIAYRSIPGVFYFHFGTAVITTMAWMVIISIALAIL
jgi:hypothetical protein